MTSQKTLESFDNIAEALQRNLESIKLLKELSFFESMKRTAGCQEDYDIAVANIADIEAELAARGV